MILTRRYPFLQNSHWLKDCALYCVIVILILYFLQPFGLSQYQGNKLLLALLFGAVTFGCCALYGQLVFRPLRQWVKPWLVWHEVLAELAMILAIGLSNFLMFVYVYSAPMSWEAFLQFLYWTLIIGLIIVAISTGLSYQRSLRSQLALLLDKTTEQQRDILVTIHDTSVRGNDLQLPINDLLFVEAQKNNVAVCFVRDGQTELIELHTTLTAVLDNLRDYENIFQCHRSFVVNLNNITSAKGNSNGYQLRLGDCSTMVPVSRSYVPKLKSFIA